MPIPNPNVIQPVRGNTGREIRLDDLDPYRDGFDSAEIVLFRTDWYKYHGTGEFLNHPFLAEEVGRMLQEKGIQTVGITTGNRHP